MIEPAWRLARRHLFGTAWVCLALAYLVVFVAAQNKIIFTDEVVFAQDFVSAANGNWQAVRIPHPPLYVLVGSVLVHAFGPALTAMRAIGGASFLLTLALIRPTMRALFPSQANLASVIAAVLWGLQPIALQGSLLVDIDNTVFVPAMLVFVWATADARRPVLVVGVSFAALLWTKLLPTTLFITFAVVAVRVLRRDRVPALIAALAGGAAIFAATMLAVSWSVGFDPRTLVATFQRTGELSKGLTKMVSRGIMGGGITAVWVGLPFVLMYIAALKRRAGDFWKSRTLLPSDALTVCALIALVMLSIGNDLPMGFPRYHYPSLLLVTMSISAWLASWSPSRRDVMVGGGLFLAAVAYFSAVIPDPLLPQYLLTFETNDLVQRLRFAAQSQLVAFGMPFAGLLAASWFIHRKGAGRLACLVFCLASWTVVDVAQARAEYSTIYEYGRSGGAAAAQAVVDGTRPDALIVVPREVDWLAGRNAYLATTLVGPEGTSAGWLAFFTSHKPSAYVLSTKEDGRYTQVTRDPAVLAHLATCFAPPRAIGSYLVWIRACA